MPYRSAKQRRYMHAKHPEVAAKWDKKYGGKVVKKKTAKKKSAKKKTSKKKSTRRGY